MATNPPDKEEGSKVISDSKREEEEVEIVFGEFKEEEEITLGFGTGTEGGIEAPEPTFVPIDPNDLDPDELPTTMATHADTLLGVDRYNANAPHTVDEIHDIKVIVKKGDRGGLDLKDLQKLHEAAEILLDTKFDCFCTQS
eukprot:14700163-Ditylum_brightwellii.AAC.1